MNLKAVVLAFLVLFSTSISANDSPEALQQAFMSALLANDAAGIAACYTEDAVNFPLGAMMETGPASVEAGWSALFESNRVFKASLSEDHMETHGDTAIAWGIFTIVADPIDGGERFEIIGRYMDVSRNVDGTWLYVADHASLPQGSE